MQNNYYYNLQNSQQHNIQNNQQNIIVEDKGEMKEQEADLEAYKGVAPILEYADSSKGEDYKPSNQESLKHEITSQATKGKLVQAQMTGVPVQMSHRWRASESTAAQDIWTIIYVFKQEGDGEADAIEHCIAQAEAEANKMSNIDGEPIELMEGEEVILGCIMMQLSLKTRLKILV